MKLRHEIPHAEARAPNYPPIEQGLDALVHKENGNEEPWREYVAACLAVKARYPKKPEGQDDK